MGRLRAAADSIESGVILQARDRCNYFVRKDDGVGYLFWLYLLTATGLARSRAVHARAWGSRSPRSFPASGPLRAITRYFCHTHQGIDG